MLNKIGRLGKEARATCPAIVGHAALLSLPTFRQVLISLGVSGACHGSLRFTCSQAPCEKQRPPRHPSK